MSTRSKKLTRQFGKILGVEDAEARLATLYDHVRTAGPAGLGDEAKWLARFPEFFTSVDKSYDEYEELIKRANSNLERSSSELNALNGTLGDLNSRITAMLDNLGQGVFSFDEKGMCSPSYSRACEVLLDGVPAGRHVAEVLSRGEQDGEVVRSIVEFLFGSHEALVTHDELLALLPADVPHSKGLSVSLGYRPILDVDGAIRAVLVIATDHTDELLAQREAKERERRTKMILRIIRERNAFVRFLHAIAAFVGADGNDPALPVGADMIRREVHTLKGNASLFCLDPLVERLHRLESLVQGQDDDGRVRALVLEAMEDIRDLLGMVREEARLVLGDGFEQLGEARVVPVAQLRTFGERIAGGADPSELQEEFFRMFVGEPVHRVLSGFGTGLQELADRYGKEIEASSLTGENFQILSFRYESLLASFSHLARNIIAHAFEDKDVRAAAGKKPGLTVTVRTEAFAADAAHWFRFVFEDDGAGIDVAKLRRRAESRGMTVGADDNAALQLIFASDVSTRDESDDLAGRGVGMSAVRLAAEELGGRARVESEKGRYTRVVIEVPRLSRDPEKGGR